MDLQQVEVFFLDCQTTGMRPTHSHLLEFAWLKGTAGAFDGAQIQSRLLQLPFDHPLPHQISQMTGIREEDLKTAHPRRTVYEEFRDALEQTSIRHVAIHYSSFEEPFLKEFFLSEGKCPDLPFRILDTAKIAKRLLPTLPSTNIRALGGFFGLCVGPLKRAHDHVRATAEIWRGLLDRLAEIEIRTLEQLEGWLAEKPAKKKTTKTARTPSPFRLSRETRLGLPKSPGVYRMYAKDGSILYVGKATSLRSRVNSYFRGLRGRDPKTRELVTQIWNLDFVAAASPLEAALLETDEIKKYDPPYNISLKKGSRRLRFYSRDFRSLAHQPSTEHPRGPFSASHAFDQLALLVESAKCAMIENIFYLPITIEKLDAGFNIFLSSRGVSREQFKTMRRALAWALWRQRKIKKMADISVIANPEVREDSELAVKLDLFSEAKEPAEVLENFGDEELSPEEIADKFERICLRAANALLRSRKMKKLTRAFVRYQTPAGQWRELQFEKARVRERRDLFTSSPPLERDEKDSAAHASRHISFLSPRDEEHLTEWKDLSIADYDRLSVLISELAKCSHSIR